MHTVTAAGINNIQTKQLKIIRIYIYIAWLYLLLFVPLFVFYIKNWLLTTVHLIDLVIIIWALWQVNRPRPKPDQITWALAVIASITVAAVMVTGGVQHSGPFLVFPYIPFVVFLRSQTSARRWFGGMLIFMSGLLLLGSMGLVTLPLGQVTFSLYIFMYLLALLLTLAYVQEKNTSDSLLIASANKLASTNRELSHVSHAQAQAFAKSEAIIKGIGEGLMVFDAKGKVERINKAAEKLLGYSQRELLGNTYIKLVKATDELGGTITAKNRPVLQAMEGKRNINTILYYTRKDGSTFPAQLSVSPIIIGDEVAGAIEIFRDVYHEKEIDRSKTEFVSLASHQLRTPLSTVSWYSEMLLAGDAGKLNKEQAQYVDEIYRGNHHMIELVGSLLNVSRVELGTFSVEPEPTNLVKLCQTIIKDLEPKIFARKIDFKEKYDRGIPIMDVDPKLMRMVIENLASNAIKYTPEAGTVTLHLKRLTQEVQIMIKDTGYGIPEGQQDKIFSKLFRADNVKARDTEGTGLGLYMVKSIIDYSGGKIWFESSENNGTTFYVNMPIRGMKHKRGGKQLD